MEKMNMFAKQEKSLDNRDEVSMGEKINEKLTVAEKSIDDALNRFMQNV